MLVVSTKRCPNCGEDKPLSEYHRQTKAKDGAYHCCKPCSRETATAWAERERERMGDAAWRAYRAENTRRARANNPAVRERGRLQSQAYNAASKRLREAHPDEFDAIYAQERYERGLS